MPESRALVAGPAEPVGGAVEHFIPGGASRLAELEDDPRKAALRRRERDEARENRKRPLSIAHRLAGWLRWPVILCAALVLARLVDDVLIGEHADRFLPLAIALLALAVSDATLVLARYGARSGAILGVTALVGLAGLVVVGTPAVRTGVLSAGGLLGIGLIAFALVITVSVSRGRTRGRRRSLSLSRAAAASVVAVVAIGLAGALGWAAVTPLDPLRAAAPSAEPDVAVLVRLDGRIRRVLVRDGDVVQPGDVLVEFDPEGTAPEQAGPSRADRADALLAVARLDALIASLSLGTPPGLRAVPDAERSQQDAAARMANAQYEESRARLAALDAEIAKRETMIRGAEERVEQARLTTRSAVQAAERQKQLYDKGFVSRNSWVERDEIRTDAERGIAAATLALEEARRNAQVARELRRVALADERRALESALADAQRRADEIERGADRGRQAGAPARLAAPVEGTVKAVAPNLVGRSVRREEALMRIAPVVVRAEAAPPPPARSTLAYLLQPLAPAQRWIARQWSALQ